MNGGDHFLIRRGIEGCHWSALGNSIFPKTVCKTYFEMVNIIMNFIFSKGYHFHARAIARRRKAWFHFRMSRKWFAVKHRRHYRRHCAWADHYFSQLFAGHKVGSRPMKRKKNLYRMITILSLYTFSQPPSQCYQYNWLLCGIRREAWTANWSIRSRRNANYHLSTGRKS